MTKLKIRAPFNHAKIIQSLFFLSGMAALIYQVTWQRMIMAFLGVDSLSATLIVAVFLGFLGFGGIAGESLATKLGRRRGVPVFCLAEMLIGLFGVLSPAWIAHLSTTLKPYTVIEKLYTTSLAIGIPVFLMGLTLPVLVENMRPYYRHLHQNVGHIYAINAFGSGAAALITVLVIFPAMGLTDATYAAAALNLITASMAFIYAGIRPHPASTAANEVSPETPGLIRKSLPLKYIAILAFFTGALTINQEISILRMLGWASGSRPWCYGLGVGTFLIGMSAGSLKIAEYTKGDFTLLLGRKWLLNSITLVIMPALSIILTGITGASVGTAVLALSLGILGYLGGCSLTILSGLLAVSNEHSSRFGYVYAANIIGSFTGSIGTGFFLFDAFPLHQIIFASSIASLLLFLLFKLHYGMPPLRVTGIMLIACIYTAASWQIFHNFYPRWKGIYFTLSLNEKDFKYSKETRSGIVGIYSRGAESNDTVIGGNVYDGKFNINPLTDTNAIHRIYVTMAMSPNPEKIVDIGLASGSGLLAALTFPSVKAATSVELNRGYYDIVRQSPLTSKIFDDPRVTFVHGDGRKFLADSPEMWDVVMINASYHWREGATLLHSKEFLKIVKDRLNPNGLLMLNTTGSDAIVATALSVFPEVWQVYNFVVAVNGRLNYVSDDTLVSRLMGSDEFQRRQMKESDIRLWLTAHRPVRRTAGEFAGCPILTDDNMAAEWGRAKCR